MYAHGLNPIPTNFTDAGRASPQLQETFLFWRIAKGGPGLPEEGGPWDSAMPAWEKFLTEEEMWDVDPLPLRLHRAAAAGARRRSTSDARRLPRARRARRRAASALGRRRRRSGADAQRRAAGKALYDKHCAQCHGEKGDGKGVAAPHLLPRPRDFTTGKFKIRTTPSGALPTDDDLQAHHRVGHAVHLDAGLARASPTPSSSELVDYVKTFSPDFANADSQADADRAPEGAEYTTESAEAGARSTRRSAASAATASSGAATAPRRRR